MRTILPLAALLLVAGCAPKNDSTDAGAPPTATPGATAQGGGSGNTVAPMGSGAAGGMTPMSGTDSVEGAGSGVGSSAIDAAHRAAAKVGGAPSAGMGDVNGGG